MGWLLIAFGLGVIAVVAGYVYSAWSGQSSGGSTTVMVKVSLAIGALVASPLLYFGRKLRARGAEVELEDDPRPPVLYLRSFGDDSDQVLMRAVRTAGAAMRFNLKAPLSEEEDLAAAFREVGPPIAIGRPGEWLPTLGFARMYVGDDEWQARVADLSAGASLTVLRIGDTDGLWWEVRRVVETLDPETVLLYLSDTATEDGRQRYDAFREPANEILPRPLPPDPAQAPFVGFDAEWRPVLLLEPAALQADARPPVLYLGTGVDSSALGEGEALAEVFATLGPVVAIGRPGEPLPRTATRRTYVRDEEWDDFVAGASWRGAPVVLQYADTERFWWVFERVAEAVDLRRIVLHVPGRRGGLRRRAYHAFRERATALVPFGLPERFGASRYLWFARHGPPRPLRPLGAGLWRWWKLIGSRDRAAIRVRAPLLQPVFETYGQAPPGLRLARWVRITLVVLAVLLTTAVTLSGDEPPPPLPFDATGDVNATWEGFAWGTRASAMRLAFPLMGDLDSTRHRNVVRSGTGRLVAGLDRPMWFVFDDGQLVGTMFPFPRDAPDATFDATEGALTAWLGAPEEDPTGAAPIRWRHGPVDAVVLRDTTGGRVPAIRLLHAEAVRAADPTHAVLEEIRETLQRARATAESLRVVDRPRP